MNNRPTPVPASSSSPLSSYLREIQGDALLSAEDERVLARAIAAGDRAAEGRLIRSNLRLVIRIARDYQGRGLALDDLVGEGNLGLIRAATDFDPDFGVRFSTYAAHWIKQAIRAALTDTAATIRLPSHMVGLLSKWQKAERALRKETGRDPTDAEVAGRLGLTRARRELVELARRSRRLVREGPGDEDQSSWSTDEAPDRSPAPGAAMEAEEERRRLFDRLLGLEPRERQVVVYRFGLDGQPPLTLKEIGRRIGITREWVRKIEVRAVAKLVDPAEAAPLPYSVRRRRAVRPSRRQVLQTA